MDPKVRVAFANEMENFIEVHARENDLGVCSFKNEFALNNRLGSSSKHGEVYAGPIVSGGPAFAIKIMPIKTKNRNELAYYKIFNKLVLEGRNPHFPLVYYAQECNSSCPFREKKRKDEPCFVLMKEYSDGDLRSWLKSNLRGLQKNNAPFLSMWSQVCLIGFGLEKAGIVHNDLHWGNMLYHSVPDVTGKYMYYRVGRKRVYVKITGQHWTVWDFGLSLPADPPYNTSVLIDMNRLSGISKWTHDHYHDGDMAADLPKVLIQLCDQIHSFANTVRRDVTYMMFLRFLQSVFARIDPTVLLVDPPRDMIPNMSIVINPRKPYKITG